MPYYPTDALTPLPNQVFNLATDVDESIELQKPGGGESFSLESGEAVACYLVPWRKCRDFIFKFLGFSYADAGYPYRLHRINPVYHPQYPWLTASTVSFGPIGPKANDTFTGTFIPGVYPGGIKVAQYEYVIATVRFTDRPWTFLEDSDMVPPATTVEPAYLNEPFRNTYFNPSPSVEMISAEGISTTRWANNQFQRVFPANTIPAPFGTLVSKNLLAFRWMWVPNEYISGPDSLTFTPKWIDSCVGRVNSDTFLGYAPGTLLLQAPTYERFRFPVPTRDGTFGYFGWNVSLNFQFFDPPRGSQDGVLTSGGGTTAGVVTMSLAPFPNLVTGANVDIQWLSTGVVKSRDGMTVTATSPTTVTLSGGDGELLPPNSTPIAIYDNAYRGNQLVPYRPNLRWYGVNREDGVSKLYPEAEFSNIFRHVGVFE